MKKFLSLIALMLVFTCMFTSCIQIDQGGKDGIDGKDGADGKDGITPTIEISSDGYWVINGVKTEYKAICNCSNNCKCNNNNYDEGNDNNDHTHNFVNGKCECGETDPNYVPEVTNEYTLGLGIVFGDITSAQINATIATVILDENGVIVAAKIDAVQNKYYIADTIVFSNLLTKKELGNDYHMHDWGAGQDRNGDGIVKEWFEQAEAFEAWCVGKTIAEVAAMETQTQADGYVIPADEALLAAGCTIQITDFIEAVVKAGNDEQATTFTTAGKIVLGLGVNSFDDGSNGDDFEATVKMNIEFAAAATVDGVIVASLNDAIQPQVKVEDGSVISTSVGKGEGVLKTKRELKEDYKMAAYGQNLDRNGDGKVLEWYLQSAAFSAHVVGMTAEEVYNLATQTQADGYVIPADEALLAAGCTIQITGFRDVVVEACGDVV